MIKEDYVSFEIAKLLEEKGFDEVCYRWADNKSMYEEGEWQPWNKSGHATAIPTLQMAMKWLRETHSILLAVDYDYECTDTSYFYKIYRLGEHGKPESVAVKGVSYDKDGNPTEHIVFYRDYERSYSDYGTYEEACEAGIKYCLENLI